MLYLLLIEKERERERVRERKREREKDREMTKGLFSQGRHPVGNAVLYFLAVRCN
jgi:hypothetical protein